jgi:NADH-quinone oxidoreductase subunit H
MPAGANKWLFTLAPAVSILTAFLAIAVIPYGPPIKVWGHDVPLQIVDLDVGVLYIFAVASLGVYGIVMAGWASNNKYALFGAMRSAAQIVSYEIPAVMSLIVVVMMVGSLSLKDIVDAQQGGLAYWLLWRYFPLNIILFLVFFTASLAECNRAPFDIPEAESELVAGFHTEYSGFFFAMFFMAEYTEMVVLSAVASVLFLGGPLAPHMALQTIFGIGLGPVWLLAKAWTLVFVMMWLRWTLPRLRVDQLMHVAWKVLLPISLTLVVVVGALVLWKPYGFTHDRWVGWPIVLGLFVFLLTGMLRALQWNRRRARELLTS